MNVDHGPEQNVEAVTPTTAADDPAMVVQDPATDLLVEEISIDGMCGVY